MAAKAAEQLYCASFLIRARRARFVNRAQKRSITSSQVTTVRLDEDQACAEYIAALVEKPAVDVRHFWPARESAAAALSRRREWKTGLPACTRGDIEACLDANRFDFAMRARDEDGLFLRRL